jgi:hypothetical protein
MPKQAEEQRKRHTVQKHPIETYKHYTIYIISGIFPALFTAEKADPTKGATVSAESLDVLKAKIDDVLDFATQIHINTYEGPDNSKVLQNTKTRIQSTAGDFNSGLAVMIEADYDLDVIIQILEKKPIRHSKKHSKTRKSYKGPIVKILCRNRTIQYGG